MFRRKKTIVLFLLTMLALAGSASFFLSFSPSGQAATIDDTIKNLDSSVKNMPALPQTMNGDKLDVPQFIGLTIKRVMEVTGAIFFVYLLYGSFLWMFSQGEAKRIERAKKVIFWSVTGIIIILLSYIVTSFIFKIFAQ